MNKTVKNNKSKNEQTKKFKKSYFDKYDDIKSHTHNIYDW